jgi:predicted LPLAT superfamily acyltransferase
VAHFGSAESLRLIGEQRQLPLSILLDRQHGRMLMQLLEQLNPDLAGSIIDASERGPQLVLNLKEALQAGRMVGIMADRALATDRSVEVELFGGPVRLPAGPWQLAHALQVPVILGFGVYHGGNRYTAHFELFCESLRLPREGRDAALTSHAQRYAERLEHHCSRAPYNWFNFYDYWMKK